MSILGVLASLVTVALFLLLALVLLRRYSKALGPPSIEGDRVDGDSASDQSDQGGCRDGHSFGGEGAYDRRAQGGW